MIFPDINRLEQMMFGELQQEQQHTVSQNLHDATPADKIAQLQQENSSLQRENAALRSENAEIKAISDRRAKAINTANAVLEANPELKKNFVAEKQKLTQMTEHKQHNNKPQSPPKSHKH